MDAQLRDEREARMETMIRQWGTSVLRTCFMCLSDAQQAEDAMQETFLKAWRNLDQFERRNGASEKTWLMHIALNVCRDQRRGRWFRHVDMSRPLEDLPLHVADALPEDRELLMDVLNLPEKLRQPILLYYYQDMTLEEVAEALGASKSTIHNRLRRAEGMLKITLTGGDCYV